MKRGQVFVRAKDKNGSWYSADVLDLDQPSFNAFVLDKLFRAGGVAGIKDNFTLGSEIEYQSVVEKDKEEVKYYGKADKSVC